MKPNNSQNNVLNVQCGAIHYQSAISTFSDVPQFEVLPQPCRCYLVEYTNGGSKFYFSKSGVFGPDGTFITEVLKEDAPRNGERYFNDAYQDDPNVFSTTLTLTTQQILGGTGFMFRQKFETWIGAFIGQLTPIDKQLLDSQVPDVWMQIFQKNSPLGLPEHIVFDVTAVNGLDQFARLCFAADIFFIQSTIHSEGEENFDSLWVYEFSEICFLQVIDPILKRPIDFGIQEFSGVNVRWIGESSRYLVSFPNEEEQDKMHLFFENLNFSRKINLDAKENIPPLPDIYQDKGQVDRKSIEDYLLSIERAFNGESEFVDIPAANGTFHRFQIIQRSYGEFDKSSDGAVAVNARLKLKEGSGSDELLTTHPQVTVVPPVLTTSHPPKEGRSDQHESNQVNEVKRNGWQASTIAKILVCIIAIGLTLFFYSLYETNGSRAGEKAAVFELHSDPSGATDHKLKSAIDLPILLSQFMTEEKTAPTWALGADANDKQILWLSSGVEPADKCGSYSGCRQGFVRVKLQGVEIQHLRQQLVPIEWSIFMASSGLPKFGPELIQVAPKCDTVECSFSFEKALSGSDVRLTQICAAGPASSRVTAFLAKVGSKLAYVVVMNNIGSGGPSNDLKILYSRGAAEAICAEEKQYE